MLFIIIINKLKKVKNNNNYNHYKQIIIKNHNNNIIFSPILVTLDGIVTELNNVDPPDPVENICCPITVSPEVKTT